MTGSVASMFCFSCVQFWPSRLNFSTPMTNRRDLTDANRNRSDIFSLLNKQQELEANFEAHMQKRGELRGLSNKSKFHQNEEELFRLVRQLKESGQSIATNLKDQPTLSGNVQKVQEDRSQLHELLQIAIDDLQHCSCDNLVLQVW